MKWPRHLTALFHDPPSPLPIPFPFKPGTFGSPSVIRPLSHYLIKRFALDSADRVELQHTYLQLLEATAASDYPTLQEIATPDLYESLKTDLENMKMKGYRLHLKQLWDGVIEFKVYNYVQNYGLSPFVRQNYPGSEYEVDVVYMGLYPFKYEYRLKNKTQEMIPEALVTSANDPYSITDLPRTSSRLHKMLSSYPACVTEVSAGFLSQRKFHITDLYSKNKVVGGEDEEEYEFHMLKFRRTFPADEERYNNDQDYRRFIDVNFTRERMRWLVSDIDQSYGLSLLPAR